MNNDDLDISIVLGSKNRKELLKATIDSIRNNGFQGKMEIIVIDGGSTDGTCNWLAKQKDIFTILQPNFKIVDSVGISVLGHSWGEFMNIGFKYAKAPWIVMVSDDLILAKGALQKGYDELIKKVSQGNKIGGGAFFFREYPRHSYFRVGLLPRDIITINHGFYNKKALEDVNYIEEHDYNFYCADGDLILRMDEKGWTVIALEDCYANHLVHKPKLGKVKHSASTLRDISNFEKRYPYPKSSESIIKDCNVLISNKAFWKAAFLNCVLGVFLKIYDNAKSKANK